MPAAIATRIAAALPALRADFATGERRSAHADVDGLSVMVDATGVSIGYHDLAELDAWLASSGATVDRRWAYEADDDLPAEFYAHIPKA